MPQVGLGVHQVGCKVLLLRLLLQSRGFSLPAQVGEEELSTAVRAALAAGYTYFDSSFLYSKETTLGKVLEQELATAGLARDQMFLLTKLPPNGLRPDLVETFLRLSLSRLRLEYLDMYLIHWPCGTVHTGKNEETHPLDSEGFLQQDLATDLEAVWAAMEDLVTKGLVRSIGLSNFNMDQVLRILKSCKIPPANLQVEVNLLHQNTELVQFCQANKMVVTAYAALGCPGRFDFSSSVVFPSDPDTLAVTGLLSQPTVVTMAKEIGCSPGQLLLSFLTKVLGVVVIPKSTNPYRIKENMDIFRISLSEDQVKVLLSMNRNIRSFKGDVMKVREQHPEFPF